MYLKVPKTPEIIYGLKVNWRPVKYIKLVNNSRKFTIDYEDYYKVCFLRWRLVNDVIVSSFRGKTICLGQLLLNVRQKDVYHRDKNPLNNCKSNLYVPKTLPEKLKLYFREYRRSKYTPIYNKPKKFKSIPL